MHLPEKSSEAAFSAHSRKFLVLRTGLELSLDGVLREIAVWADESDGICCRYCAHVASSTFVMLSEVGICCAVRQDGDSIDQIQEAIDTYPVDCIRRVDFENLDEDVYDSFRRTLWWHFPREEWALLCI